MEKIYGQNTQFFANVKWHLDVIRLSLLISDKFILMKVQQSSMLALIGYDPIRINHVVAKAGDSSNIAGSLMLMLEI